MQQYRTVLILACVLGSLLSPWAQEQPVTGLTGAAGVSRAYDAIFDARFDEVPRLIEEACGPAPPEACGLLEALDAWWRIQLDPHDRSHDEDFRTRVDAAIAAAEAWTAREPSRAEAWFYLGGAYAARVQWRALRGENIAAAFDGKRIKEALERAVALDPGLDDAYFALGLYRYYADVAPAALRILRWLLLLPGGDREQGLEEMRRARSGGELVQSEADYQLHLIHLWYERQPRRALELLEALQARHPHNPHFLQAAARIHDVYLHDPAASLGAWRALLDAALAGRVAEPAMAEAAARLGIARQLDRIGETDAALDHLRVVAAAQPAAPYGAHAEAYLRIGAALDRLGRRADAIEAYRSAIALAPEDDPLDTIDRARAAMRAHR